MGRACCWLRFSLGTALHKTAANRLIGFAENLFLHPPQRLLTVDGLMTNFHLPRSTLFMLVSALAGIDTMHAAYTRARTAGELARIGVAAGCEFDKNSAAPVRLHTIKYKG